MDSSDPDIIFDKQGVCNHCRRYDELVKEKNPSNEEKNRRQQAIIKEIKKVYPNAIIDRVGDNLWGTNDLFQEDEDVANIFSQLVKYDYDFYFILFVNESIGYEKNIYLKGFLRHVLGNSFRFKKRKRCVRIIKYENKFVIQSKRRLMVDLLVKILLDVKCVPVFPRHEIYNNLLLLRKIMKEELKGVYFR